MISDLRYPNPVLTEHQSFPYVKSKTIPTPDWEHLGLGFDDESVSLEPYDLAVALTPNAIDIAPETADQRIVVYTTSKLLFDDNDRPIGFINESSWGVSDWYPLITEPRRKWDSNTQELVPFIPMPNSKPIWVDLVLYNPKDYSDPFHLHGYSFYVVASESSLSGWRSYMLDPYTGGTIWLSPAKKDTILVPRKGHVVLRFLADNPGIWMFHSSVMFHMATGTAMGILVGGNEQHTVVDDRAEDSCPFDRPY
jgi:FtsP/CotA-like multicopper oxidase with cupredoxin domain